MNYYQYFTYMQERYVCGEVASWKWQNSTKGGLRDVKQIKANSESQ